MYRREKIYDDSVDEHVAAYVIYAIPDKTTSSILIACKTGGHGTTLLMDEKDFYTAEELKDAFLKGCVIDLGAQTYVVPHMFNAGYIVDDLTIRDAVLYYVNSSGKVAMVGTETKFSIA